MSGHDLELAGFADENGRLGRQVPSGYIRIPQKIWLQKDCICWRTGKEPRIREVSQSMLNQFLRLSDANSILEFAREWGVMALSNNLREESEPGHSYLPGRQIEKGSEPIPVWQYYSKRARAVLSVAAALRQGKLGDVSDWDEFAKIVVHASERASALKWIEGKMIAPGHWSYGLGFSIYAAGSTKEDRLESSRYAIAGEIRAWLECWKNGRTGGVSDLTLRWIEDQQRFDLQIDYHGLLFPAIALQLALVVADADSLYSCSGCGKPYIRPRERKRPKSGWANYCDQCLEDGVAQRRAVETYRQKRGEAVRLHAAGMSVSKIAEQLHADPDSVLAWIEKGGTGAKTKA